MWHWESCCALETQEKQESCCSSQPEPSLGTWSWGMAPLSCCKEPESCPCFCSRRSRKFQLTLVSAKGIYSKPKCMQRPDSPAQWKVPSFSKASSPLAVKKVEGVEGMGNQAWPDLSELTGRNHQVPQRGGQDFGSTDQSCRAPWPELHLQSDSQQSMS